MALHSNAAAMLLADLVEFPKRTRTDHAYKEDDPRHSKNIHGIKDPNGRINTYLDKGLLRDKHPDFSAIGFEAQAFIDVKLETASHDSSEQLLEDYVRQELGKIDEIISLYTVFGDIDLRCEVVGITLRHIEGIAMRIREITGVQSSVTSIIIDETDYNSVRSRWANLIRAHADRLEPKLPKP